MPNIGFVITGFIELTGASIKPLLGGPHIASDGSAIDSQVNWCQLLPPCIDMWKDMCKDMCTDMCMDMCMDMCIDMCIDMCVDMRVDMHIDMSESMLVVAGRSIVADMIL